MDLNSPARRIALLLLLLVAASWSIAPSHARAQLAPPPDQQPQADWSRWRFGQPQRPVTVRSAAELARVLSTSHRDVLIPAGVTWEIERPLIIPANRGGTAERPRRIGVAGRGDRPVINCVNTQFLEVRGAGHLEIAGIAAIAQRTGLQNEGGIFIYGGDFGHILLEDLVLVGFKNNLAVVADKGTQITDLVINRCIFREAWHAGGEHAQNIFFNRVDRWQILDTVLYHAGWRPGRPELRTRFNHNLYIDLDEGDPNTHGEMRGTYTGYASSHAFQIRGSATVTDTIAERSAYLGSIFQGGTIERYVGMFADHIPAEEQDFTGIGLEIGTLGGTATIRDAVLAYRESQGRKTAINCAADPVLENVRILGPWSTNSYGPVAAGGRRHDVNKGPDVFYSEQPLQFTNSAAKVDDQLLEAWLTRPRAQWDEKKSPAAACAALLEAYTPR